MNKERQLLHNSIKCPDGTVLVSKHRYDFQGHVQKDGREYFIDGGLSYQRIGFSDEEFEDLSVYTDSPHKLIREKFTWTKRMNEDGEMIAPEQILLKDITDNHLDVLISWTQDDYPEYINQVFVDEKQWRNV